MKVSVKKTHVERVVEAHDEETTVYSCDCCDFESEDERKVKGHYGKTHAVKDRKKVDGIEFLKFDTKEDLDAWAETMLDEFYCRGYHRHESFTSGWYKYFTRLEPCSSGCCTDKFLFFESVESMVRDLEQEIEEKRERLAALKAEFGTAESTLEIPPYMIVRGDGEPLEGEDEENIAVTEGQALEVAEYHARKHPGIKCGIYMLVRMVEEEVE
jgi:hypothetical protein